MKDPQRSEARSVHPADPGALLLPTPAGFSFRRTVLSHGWCSLPPFRFDRDRFTLHRIVSLPAEGAIAVRIEEDPGPGGMLRLAWDGEGLAQRDREALVAQVRRMLRLDEDLEAFYRMTERASGFSWIPGNGAGRLLRCPTVFEDLVKLLCTTNCTWSLTEIMVKNLVEKLGVPAQGAQASSSRLRTTGAGTGIDWVSPEDGGARPAPQRAFPTPAAMAAKTERFYETQIRAGYRAGALAALSRQVDSGKLDLEAWAASELPSEELKRRILEIRGAGPYTAENLLKLLGRYEGLGLDSWSRAKFARMHPRVGRGAASAAREAATKGRTARTPGKKRAAGTGSGFAGRSHGSKGGSRGTNRASTPAHRARGSSAASRSSRPRPARRPPSDAEIERYYSRFGSWRGLAFWCDLTRDWLEDAASESGAARAEKFKT